MEAAYIVEFSYPDGHIEELNVKFKSLEEAVNYAENMLGQIAHTEKFHGGNDFDDDGMLKKKKDPFYCVIKILNNKRTLAFSSK